MYNRLLCGVTVYWTIQCLLRVRSFLSAGQQPRNSLKPLTSHREGILEPPFHRWANWGRDNFPEAKVPGRGGAKIWILGCLPGDCDGHRAPSTQLTAPGNAAAEMPTARWEMGPAPGAWAVRRKSRRMKHLLLGFQWLSIILILNLFITWFSKKIEGEKQSFSVCLYSDLSLCPKLG